MAKRPFVGAFCLAMLLGTSSWAATVEPGQGSLTINQGQGFQPVNSRIERQCRGLPHGCTRRQR